MSFPHGYEFRVGNRVLVYRISRSDTPTVPSEGVITKVGVREFVITTSRGPIRFSQRFGEMIGNDRVRAEPFSQARLDECAANSHAFETVQNIQNMLYQLGHERLRKSLPSLVGDIVRAEQVEAVLQNTVRRLKELGIQL